MKQLLLRVPMVLAQAVLLLAGAVVIMAMLSAVIDTNNRRSEERDRCLRAAANAYEAERCR